MARPQSVAAWTLFCRPLTYLCACCSFVFSSSVPHDSNPVMPTPNNHSAVMEVPHVRQTQSWDCGLACVVMVLEAMGIKGVDLDTIKQLCPTQSTWTVDLAYLLHRFGLNVLFLTVTIGANPDFASESFYLDNMEEDEHRVNRLFREAASKGITICSCSMSATQLQQAILSARCLAIALVDKRKLSTWFNATQLLGPQLCSVASGYTGHYVVICGYDAQRQAFLIQDPARSMPSGMWVAADVLESARKSFGTDEDLLVISTQPLKTNDLLV
eukprot:evm.model.scf_541.3 EVM.evm.TU.scf_541.3   scf_541:55491-57195(-)